MELSNSVDDGHTYIQPHNITFDSRPFESYEGRPLDAGVKAKHK